MRKLLGPHPPSWRPSKQFSSTHDIVWLFDMDNTLHDCSQGIFNAMHQRMTKTIMQMLDIGYDAANQLRTDYWRRYGASVIGMERHHNIDPHEFLTRSHAFDSHPLIRAEPGLARKFSLLEGRKILLTNAPLAYAREVLSFLGLLPHFESLWTITHMRLQQRMQPKPSLALMRQILARLKHPSHRVVLVEDTLKNLKAAKQVGMGTVYVHHPHTPFSAPDQTSRLPSRATQPLKPIPEQYQRHKQQRLVMPSYVDVRVNKLNDLLLMRRFTKNQ